MNLVPTVTMTAIPTSTSLPAPGPEYTDGKVLFEDAFDNRPMIDWWDSQFPSCLHLAEIEEPFLNVLQMRDCPQLRLGPYHWGDYRVKLDIKPFLFYAGKLNIDVRVASYSETPGLRSYRFELEWPAAPGGEGYARLIRNYSPGDAVLNYSSTELQSVSGITQLDHNWSRIQIDAYHSELRLYIDEALIIRIIDDVTAHGKIMLSSVESGSFYIDNVEVSELIPAQNSDESLPGSFLSSDLIDAPQFLNGSLLVHDEFGCGIDLAWEDTYEDESGYEIIAQNHTDNGNFYIWDTDANVTALHARSAAYDRDSGMRNMFGAGDNVTIRVRASFGEDPNLSFSQYAIIKLICQ